MRPDLYGAFWMRKRIVDEVRAHLYEAVERLQETGMSEAEAERYAVERFGNPADVARTFAQMKGVGVATNITRWSGLGLVLGVAMLFLRFGTQAIEATRGSVDVSSRLWFWTLAGGVLLVAFGVVGIFFRVRGQLGRWGRWGFRGLCIGGPLLATAYGPQAGVGGLLTIAGAVCFVIGVVRARLLPRSAMRWLVIATAWPVVAFVIMQQLPDFENYDSSSLVAVIAFAPMAGALIKLGIHLWNEPPFIETAGAHPAGI